MVRRHLITSASALAFTLVLGTALPRPVRAAAQDYRFELAGKPQPAPGGKSIIPVRLVHIPDGKSVTDAVLFESRADMAPMGMPTMTAPIKVTPSAKGGVYRVEVEPGMAGTWALTLAAKIQGETETVRGTLNAELVK